MSGRPLPRAGLRVLTDAFLILQSAEDIVEHGVGPWALAAMAVAVVVLFVAYNRVVAARVRDLKAEHAADKVSYEARIENYRVLLERADQKIDRLRGLAGVPENGEPEG